MPELPEVETIKRDLQKSIIGFRISQIKIYDSRVLRGVTPRQFIQKLQGRIFTDIARRGKALIFTIDNANHLFVQLRMTGHWFVADRLADAERDRSLKITFTLSPERYLVYNDQRVLGTLMLVENLDSLKFLTRLGVEPFSSSFSLGKLTEMFSGRKAPIKTVLMNQNVIAGIGNIYASEILFASRIDPRRGAASLKKSEIQKIYRQTRVILQKAIDQRGTSMRNYLDASGKKGNFLDSLKVYGRRNARCYLCQGPIVKIVQAGRSTFFCDNCQK